MESIDRRGFLNHSRKAAAGVATGAAVMASTSRVSEATSPVPSLA